MNVSLVSLKNTRDRYPCKLARSLSSLREHTPTRTHSHALMLYNRTQSRTNAKLKTARFSSLYSWPYSLESKHAIHPLYLSHSYSHTHSLSLSLSLSLTRTHTHTHTPTHTIQFKHNSDFNAFRYFAKFPLDIKKATTIKKISTKSKPPPLLFFFTSFESFFCKFLDRWRWR